MKRMDWLAATEQEGVVEPPRIEVPNPHRNKVAGAHRSTSSGSVHRRIDHPFIPCRLLRVRCVARSNGLLPVNTAKLWRGTLGKALRTLCETGASTCDGCLVLPDCPYGYAFETRAPLDSGLLKHGKGAPSPFALHSSHATGGWVLAGDAIDLELTLFGRLREFEPVMFRAIEEAAAAGLGSDRVTFSLEAITAVDAGPTGPRHPPPRSVLRDLRIRFNSPVRCTTDGRVLGPSELKFGDIFSRLLRRIQLLMALHCDLALDVDYRALNEAATHVSRPPQLRWADDWRWSASQQREVPLGGVLGEFHCDLRGAPQLHEYLVAGTLVGVGKDTVMGLGRYVLE